MRTHFTHTLVYLLTQTRTAHTRRPTCCPGLVMWGAHCSFSSHSALCGELGRHAIYFYTEEFINQTSNFEIWPIRNYSRNANSALSSPPLASLCYLDKDPVAFLIQSEQRRSEGVLTVLQGPCCLGVGSALWRCPLTPSYPHTQGFCTGHGGWATEPGGSWGLSTTGVCVQFSVLDPW